MSLFKINAALVSGYRALFNPDLPTGYENRDFTAPVGGVWAAVFNLPADKRPVTLGDGGWDEYVGIFQIDYHVPENLGTKNLHYYADVTTTYFLPGTRITYDGQEVYIRKSWPSPIRRGDDGSYVISVSVSWLSRALRSLAGPGQTLIPGSPQLGPSDYLHTQSVAATPWTVNHNLGRLVSADVYNAFGVQVVAQVTNVTINQTVITLDLPMAGYAVIN